MIKLLNFWIKNLYVDKISMQYYFKLKEIYDNITILIDNPYLANNPKIIEMELVRKFIEDKILYSPGNSDKLNKPISIELITPNRFISITLLNNCLFKFL